MFLNHIPCDKVSFTKFVKFTKQGNIFEIMAYDHKSQGNGIIKVDKEHYYDLTEPVFAPDGSVPMNANGVWHRLYKKGDFQLHTAENGYTYELRSYRPTVNRSQSPNETRKTFKRIRALINTNVTDVRKCKFITLTYSENMTDTEKLKRDLSSFNKRFKYYINSLCDDKGVNKGFDFEYIAVLEPQGRGAWHAHIIYIFNKQIQYIDNNKVHEIWCSGRGNTDRGFTTTRKIDNVDNVGAYLTAYLADIEVTDDITFSQNQYLQNEKNNQQIKECNVPEYDNFGNLKGKKKKKFIKGGRLSFYPPGFHIYRCSRGIKRPETLYTTYGDAMNEIGADAVLTFSHSVELTDGENFKNRLTYEFYNKTRKIKKRKNIRTSMQKIIECANEYYTSPHNRELITDGKFTNEKAAIFFENNTTAILDYLEKRQN